MTDKSTNLDKMRARLALLENPDSANGKKQFAEDTVMWKLPTLEEGAKHIRLLPGDDGDPFRTIQIHYDLAKYQFRSLTDCGEPDPVDEALKTVWANWRKAKEAGDADEQKRLVDSYVKKMKARPRHFVQIVVRGEEDKGARIWSHNDTQHTEIVRKFTHVDYGDLADPKEGYDIIVTPKKSGKVMPNGKVLEVEYSLEFRTKPTPLAKTEADRERLLATRHDIDQVLNEKYYKPYSDVEQIVENFLSAVEAGQDVKAYNDAPRRRNESAEESIDSLVNS